MVIRRGDGGGLVGQRTELDVIGVPLPFSHEWQYPNDDRVVDMSEDRIEIILPEVKSGKAHQVE
jgi:hypothetical protein